MMKINVLTLFPQMMEAVLGDSIIGRARKNGKLDINFTNIRDYTKMKHGHVDDSPYGGGRGMVMAVQPIKSALEAISAEGVKPYVVYMSPQGRVFTQDIAKELLEKEHLVFLCGHYEGVDERVIEVILRAAPERIVYVSCNPATQARDLQLMDGQYKVVEVQPVDMFPHTHHVENVVKLVRR